MLLVGVLVSDCAWAVPLVGGFEGDVGRPLCQSDGDVVGGDADEAGRRVRGRTRALR